MTTRETSPFSEIEKGFETFNSSISSIEQAYSRISEKIDAYQISENIPRDYLEEMAGNLAHEIRNPLAGIATLVELLSDDNNQVQAGNIGGILQGIERIDKIVENLIVFSRPVRLQKVNCDFSDILIRAVGTLKLELNDGGQSEYTFRQCSAGPICHVTIDPVLMLQAIRNILQNAVTAMPNGGEITLSVSVSEKHILLDIADQGTGLQETDFEKPFYPFYTTKTYGMGLGLPTSRLIVEKHGGRIWIADQHTKGVVVRTALPLTDYEQLHKKANTDCRR